MKLFTYITIQTECPNCGAKHDIPIEKPDLFNTFDMMCPECNVIFKGAIQVSALEMTTTKNILKEE